MTWEQALSIVSFVAVVGGGVGVVLVTRARVDRIERDVEKLDITKASKESVDGLHGLLERMQADFDRRFDRLERLLSLAIGREDTKP